ncbi:hypothetical protein SAMN04489712_10847 [Thermomonospora echinospora]|uniref:Uncharacterized protein n=1 Tax=Thermomonospora echinospora TaxID=1992 RepID=A0A1H6BW68_9ACTN|nr:hypothetical protein [Thermomonospora echinospora]SEG64695.1 hypothetical protein SAMN04489712_10847 [Thermomonospora echinospora]
MTDEELNALIRARLELAGVDLNQLPESPDPRTGSPTREQAMEYLRTFLAGAKVGGVRGGGRPAALNTWRPPAASPELAQQLSAPLEYPSITEAWTDAV